MKHKNLTLAQTKKLAFALAKKSQKKDAFIGLCGPLGSGKTTFTQSFAKAMGLKNIKSPTFIVRMDYKTRNHRSFHHLDLYRLNSWKELENIGIDDLLSQKNRTVVIEWADKFPKLLKSCDMIIKFIVNKKRRDMQILSLGLFIFLALPILVSATTIEFEETKWELSPVSLFENSTSVRSDFDLKTYAASTFQNDSSSTPAQLLDQKVLDEIEKIILAVNRENKSARLIIEDGRATQFEPDQEGRVVDVYALKKIVLKGGSQKLPVVTSSPTIALASTNNLGINTLVATGESDFFGSPKNRRHNIKVGAEKFNGVIISPGEEFSFNKFLGDVDGEHGFLPELVIKRTGVVPEFGGGLCQVSSTTFRAAMNSGLPILERRNHSFAVRYYAPQGTDATIYPGSTDLRFKNDLPSHLLIRTRVETNKLYFDFYGTKDERVIAFDGPYQYDKKTDGSMKATWTRKVTQEGQTAEQTFKSVYLPPALFHPEEQASTPNPPPAPAPTPDPAPPAENPETTTSPTTQ